MAITRDSYAKKRRQCKHKRKLINRWKKFKKSPQITLDFEALFEEQLYELNSNTLHLKLYIKKMMYEYVGETREEIAVFYAMAQQLHNKTNDHYYSIMHRTSKAIMVDIPKYREEYEGILDLCGITTEEVYENMFGDNDDGYETPHDLEPAEPVTSEKEIDSLLCDLKL